MHEHLPPLIQCHVTCVVEMVLLRLEYVSKTESHLPSCYHLHESKCQMSPMEKYLQTDRYVMERCATNYFCTSDSGIKLHLKLHCYEKQGLENLKYALYIMSHTVAFKYKDESWLCMRFVDPHGGNTNDFVTRRR